MRKAAVLLACVACSSTPRIPAENALPTGTGDASVEMHGQDANASDVAVDAVPDVADSGVADVVADAPRNWTVTLSVVDSNVSDPAVATVAVSFTVQTTYNSQAVYNYTVSGGGPTSFTIPRNENAPFTVAVLTQPVGQSGFCPCYADPASGAVTGDVAIQVVCPNYGARDASLCP